LFVHPVIKHRDTQVLSCPPAPVVFHDGSRSDIRFIAGMMVDHRAFHQHLHDAGILTSRAWLTQPKKRALMLLEQIHDAQMASIYTSRALTVDETPIKAGPNDTGEM
jgi:transposase